MGYLYVCGTLFFTVAGQILLKYRMPTFGQLPSGFNEIIGFFLSVLTDIYVLLTFGFAFIASLLWVAAMTKLEISRAYPFMSLAPVLVFMIGIVFLNEQFTWGKVVGLILIILGVISSAKY
jgi:multidrug transporter EmrE-like cation transporter